MIAHWAQRAKGVRHPFLKARYADLTWDLCKVVAGTRRDPEMARAAMRAHLEQVRQDSQVSTRSKSSGKRAPVGSKIGV